MSVPDSNITASALTSARAQLEAAFADVPMSDRVRRVVQASSDTQRGVFTLDGRMVDTSVWLLARRLLGLPV